MTEKKQRAAALAAASVMGLSLGMVALNADADQVKHQTQGPSDQLKSGFLKTPTNQGKFIAGDHKTGTSNQIKWQGVSNQHKGQTPSTELNPQPEPPKPTGTGTPK